MSLYILNTSFCLTCSLVLGPPVQYGEIKQEVVLPPPLLGQHTAETLRALLGYDRSTIDELDKSGAIQVHASSSAAYLWMSEW